MTLPGSQRMPSLTREEWTDEVRDVFAVYEGDEGWQNGSKYNFTHWFAGHPKLAHRWMAYNYALTRGVLDPRLREIVVMRVAHTYKSEYEWIQHVKIAELVGVDHEHRKAIRVGPSSPFWGELERNCLAAADALCAQHDIDDALWEKLSRDLDRKELMELLFIIGSYTLLAWVLRTVRMPIEPDDVKLLDQFGLTGKESLGHD